MLCGLSFLGASDKTHLLDRAFLRRSGVLRELDDPLELELDDRLDDPELELLLLLLLLDERDLLLEELKRNHICSITLHVNCKIAVF